MNGCCSAPQTEDTFSEMISNLANFVNAIFFSLVSAEKSKEKSPPTPTGETGEVSSVSGLDFVTLFILGFVLVLVISRFFRRGQDVATPVKLD